MKSFSCLVILNIFAILTIDCLFAIEHDVNNDFSLIPRNFFEAISLIKHKENMSKIFSSKKVDQYLYNDKYLNFNIYEHIHNIIHLFDDATFPNLTQSCLLQVLSFSKAFSQKEEWTIKMIDSFGKPPPGILDGALLWIGEYNECINITVKPIDFQGKFCVLAKPTIPGALTELAISVCMPKQCTNDDIAQLVNFAIESLPPNITKILPITINNISSSYVNCQESLKLDSTANFAITLLSIIVSIVLIGTIYDITYEYLITKKLTELKNSLNSIKKYSLNENEDYNQLINQDTITQESIISSIIRSFSFYKNVKKIFKISKNDDQLQCLNAIRVLSLSWVILGHTYIFGISLTNNLSVEILWLQRFSFLIVSNAFFSVDSFFFLSGLLTSYIFMKEAYKLNGKVSIGFMIKYYIHRYWRLTPVYMILLMFEATLTRYIGSGPLYPQGGFEQNMCKDTWWTNLLYINNLVKVENMCYAITWYMANDMQFHWIAPIILIPFSLKKYKLGFYVSGVLIFFSFLSIGLILNYHHGAEIGILAAGTESMIYNKYIYDAPWARIGPFIIGILLGYIIFAEKSNIIQNKLNKKINIIGWLLSLFMCSLLVFGLYPDFNNKPLSRMAHIFYQSVSRTLWAISLGFIVYSCLNGYGGIINRILTWEIWTPLSRLSYSAYLVHQIILIYFYATMQHPLYLQDQTMIYYFMSHWVFSYSIAILVSTFFEIPFITLEKFIFKWK